MIITLSKAIIEHIDWFEKYNSNRKSFNTIEIEIDDTTQKVLSIQSKQERWTGRIVNVIWDEDNCRNGTPHAEVKTIKGVKYE